jgi:hypothetical protein
MFAESRELRSPRQPLNAETLEMNQGESPNAMAELDRMLGNHCPPVLLAGILKMLQPHI